jgi:hypothetical protein
MFCGSHGATLGSRASRWGYGRLRGGALGLLGRLPREGICGDCGELRSHSFQATFRRRLPPMTSRIPPRFEPMPLLTLIV